MQNGGDYPDPKPPLRQLQTFLRRLSGFDRVHFHPADKDRRNSRKNRTAKKSGNSQNQSRRRFLARSAARIAGRCKVLPLLSAEIRLIPLRTALLLTAAEIRRWKRRSAVAAKCRLGQIYLVTILTSFAHIFKKEFLSEIFFDYCKRKFTRQTTKH